MIKIKSEVTGIKYDPAEVLYITLIPQAVIYMQHGAQIIDVSVRCNKLAIGFWRKDHNRLKDAWNKSLLNIATSEDV